MTPNKTKTKQTSFNFFKTRTTGVNPIRTHGFGVYKGRRVVWSVRVDEKLLKQAKPVLRGWFGSDCRGVETLLAGLVACSNGQQLVGVNPSRTQKFEIGKLVIERNLRSRRKLVVEETEVTETKVLGCGFCLKPAVAVYEDVNSKIQKPACQYHAGILGSHEKWQLVEEGS